MKLTPKFGEIFFACSASFLALMLALSVAGTQNASVINSALNIETSRTVSGEGGETADANYFPQTYETSDELIAAYESLCRETEEEGIVLLKNDNKALPLSNGAKVSLFAQGSYNMNYATTGSSATDSTDSYASMKDALEESGRLSVNPTLASYYTSSDYTGSYGRKKSGVYTINEAPYSALSGVTSSFSSYGDAAIVTLSRNSGEGTDISTSGSDGLDGSYLSISKEEQDLLQNLTTLKKSGTFKSIIVLINTAVGMQLDFLDPTTTAGQNIDVDACLWIGNTGSQGAYAIGEVLTGEVNPSGRSVDTFAKDNFSSPAMASWMYNGTDDNGNTTVTQSYSNFTSFDFKKSAYETLRYYEVDVEGIYVGYRYYETRYEDYVMGTQNTGTYDYSSVVAYPFGYGLSYSDFSYSGFSVTENKDEDGNATGKLDVSVTVTNNGSVAGKEVVQLYLQKPYSDYDKTNSIEKASVELVGYAKTQEIAGGGNETVTITIDPEQFKTYDANEAKTYILDAGDYYLTAAKDSHDAVNNILAAKGYTPANTDSKMDAAGDAELVNKVLTQTSTDTTTYAVSSETGKAITNQLDNADVNKYSGSTGSYGTNSVTYVSRNNWTGTYPKAAATLVIASDQMATDLHSNNTVEEDGSTMPAYGEDNEMTLAMLRGKDYDDEDWEPLLNQMTFAEQALLICDGYHLTHAVTSVAKPSTVDENGPTSVTGSVTGCCLPSEGIWAASFNDELLERIGNLMGDDCIMAGVQGLYAPGVNIHRAPFCGRAHEYFSEDPYLTGMASAAEVKGVQERGVVAYVKHYAFNECETNRNGVGVWLNEQEAREIYLLPFEISMTPSKGNAHAIMTSFNRVGCVWSSACSGLMINIARDEWNFDGFSITDASSGNGGTYMTFYDGIMNGTCLYDGTDDGTSLDSYASSARFCNMMREASHRILYVVCNFSAAMNGIASDTTIVAITPWWQVLITTLEIIGIVLVVGSAAVYVVAEVFKHKKPEDSNTGTTGTGPDNKS